MKAKATEIHCTPQELAQLRAMERSTQPEVSNHAWAIDLACAGWMNVEIADELGISAAKVSSWRRAFAKQGMDTLPAVDRDLSQLSVVLTRTSSEEKRDTQRVEGMEGVEDRENAEAREELPDSSGTVDLPQSGSYAPMALYLGADEQISVRVWRRDVQWDGTGRWIGACSAHGLPAQEEPTLVRALLLAAREEGKSAGRESARLQTVENCAGDGAAFLEMVLSLLPRGEEIRYEIFVCFPQITVRYQQEQNIFFMYTDFKNWVFNTCHTFPPAYSRRLERALTEYHACCQAGAPAFVWMQRDLPDYTSPLPGVPASVAAQFQRLYLELKRSGALTPERGKTRQATITLTTGPDGRITLSLGGSGEELPVGQ